MTIPQHSVIDTVEHILSIAIVHKASDIHIEAMSTNYRIRIRCQGKLNDIEQLPSKLGQQIVVRLKVLAQLNITECRLPQDGRFTYKEKIDIRMSTIATFYGEKVVLRLFDLNRHALDINELGMTAEQEDHLQHALSSTQGLILITGPTGSGKSMTLYSALQWLIQFNKNIITVEDPIEIILDGINQTAVNTKIDLTFAKLLRAILRQDPDVIMVGEIRDCDTAKIVIQAAQTGHLVLSTVHASSDKEVIDRLVNLGLSSAMLKKSLSLIVSQRLKTISAYQNKLQSVSTLNNSLQAYKAVFSFIPYATL